MEKSFKQFLAGKGVKSNTQFITVLQAMALVDEWQESKGTEDEDVFKAVKSELDYVSEQEKVEESHVVEDFPLAAGLEAIRYNLDKANKEWYVEKAPYRNAMKYIRKIAGICFKMGIKYGMPRR